MEDKNKECYWKNNSISNPEILLIDEATITALDSINKEKNPGFASRYKKQKKNNTMILVTHNIEEAVFLGNILLL